MAKSMKDILKVGDKLVNNYPEYGLSAGRIWTVEEFDSDGDAWLRTPGLRPRKCISIHCNWKDGKFSKYVEGSVRVGDKVRWKHHIGPSSIMVAEVIELPSSSRHGHLFHPDWPCSYSFSENPLHCWEKIS